MATISSIVNVNISIATQGVAQTAYNVLMLLSSTKAFTQLYQQYDAMSDVAAVFSPDSPEYVAAQTFFVQSPTSSPLIIGRRPVDTMEFTILDPIDYFLDYFVVINGMFVYVSGSTAVSSASITFANSNTAALSPWNSGNVITGTIDGTAMVAVTATGVAATDIAAVVASMQTAGGASIGTITSSSSSTANVTIVISTNASFVPVSVADIAVTPSSGVITYRFTYSANVLATALAEQINNPPPISAGITALVTASVLNNSITVTSITPESTGGTSWTFNSYVGQPNGLPYVPPSPTSSLIFVSQAVAGYTYTITIAGVAYSYTAPLDVQSTAQIAQGLVTAINGSANAPTLDVCTVTYNASLEAVEILSNILSIAGNPLGVRVLASPQQLMYVIANIYVFPANGSVLASDVTTAITNIANQNSSWYAIACTDRTESVVIALAQYASANSKLFGTASSDPAIYNTNVTEDSQLGTPTIAYMLYSQGYGNRAFCIYNQDAGNDVPPDGVLAYPEMGWFGRMLSTFPGSQNWAFQNLNGVSAVTGLSSTQIANVFAKNVNMYQQIGGVKIMRWGTLSEGNAIYIDVLRGLDWVTSSMQESIYAALVSSGKIPYTSAGINTIVNRISGVLSDGVGYGILSTDPPYTVTAPLISSIPSSDKTNRVLNNVAFTATIAGAINKINVNGTVTF